MLYSFTKFMGCIIHPCYCTYVLKHNAYNLYAFYIQFELMNTISFHHSHRHGVRTAMPGSHYAWFQQLRAFTLAKIMNYT